MFVTDRAHAPADDDTTAVNASGSADHWLPAGPDRGITER
jgi:hypothetical protein